MSENANKKGVSFKPVDELSKEAKDKLNALMTKKKESLERIISDYRSHSVSVKK